MISKAGMTGTRLRARYSAAACLARDAGLQPLLAQGAERRSIRVTVQGHQQAPGEQGLAAAGQLHPGLCDGNPRCQPAGRPETRPDREHLPGPRGRQRGDSGRVGARIGTADGDHPRSGDPGGGHGGQRPGIAAAGAHEQRQMT
jgi:hypothetical protein